MQNQKGVAMKNILVVIVGIMLLVWWTFVVVWVVDRFAPQDCICGDYASEQLEPRHKSNPEGTLSILDEAPTGYMLSWCINSPVCERTCGDEVK